MCRFESDLAHHLRKDGRARLIAPSWKGDVLERGPTVRIRLLPPLCREADMNKPELLYLMEEESRPRAQPAVSLCCRSSTGQSLRFLNELSPVRIWPIAPFWKSRIVRLSAPASKPGVPQGTVSSNLTSSATFHKCTELTLVLTSCIMSCPCLLVVGRLVLIQ